MLPPHELAVPQTDQSPTLKPALLTSELGWWCCCCCCCLQTTLYHPGMANPTSSAAMPMTKMAVTPCNHVFLRFSLYPGFLRNLRTPDFIFRYGASDKERDVCLRGVRPITCWCVQPSVTSTTGHTWLPAPRRPRFLVYENDQS